MRKGRDASAPMQLLLINTDKRKNEIKGERKEKNESGCVEKQFLNIKEEKAEEKRQKQQIDHR